jgi:hypothetical protein
MRIEKPPLPARIPLDKEMLKRKWNPKIQCNIHNPMPQKLWPFKMGQAVYWIDAKYDYLIRSGRVSWYHPSRELDASSVTTPGHPFVNIDGQLPSIRYVFPFTSKGWQTAVLCLSIIATARAERCRTNAKNEHAEAARHEDISTELFNEWRNLRKKPRKK